MKRQSGLLVMLLLLAATLNSCYTHRVVGLLQDRPDLPQYERTEYEPYRLHINDEIIYRLITMDETIAKTLAQGTTISQNEVNSYRVYSDGTVDLPFLDPIYVQGLTLEEAQDTIERHFREIIPDAVVKLSVYNKTFTIIGDINSGTYPIYKEKLTIFQALSMSGDLMNQGDRQHVRILRPRDNQEPEVLDFDIRTNTVIDSKYYYVYPNDVIYVARSKGSFYKVASYSGFLSLITSSIALLVSVLNYTTVIP